MEKQIHNFGEHKEEMGLPVWQSPKYLSSKAKAIEMIESNKYGLNDADFWILMNKTKSGKMAYTGLIISHNGCLKINDTLEDELKFKEEYCTSPIQFENGLYMEYRDKRDGMYEIGEISKTNCTNGYPYAMLLKRTFDRVVLKKSKLAFYGVYSDSESEEFKDNNVGEDTEVDNKPKDKKATKKSIEEVIKDLKNADFMANATNTIAMLKELGIKNVNDLNNATESIITSIKGAIVKDIGVQEQNKLTEQEKAGIY